MIGNRLFVDYLSLTIESLPVVVRKSSLKKIAQNNLVNNSEKVDDTSVRYLVILVFVLLVCMHVWF